MSTVTLIDNTAEDSNQIECYIFSVDGVLYGYTTANLSVEIEGVICAPLPISRTRITTTTNIRDQNTVSVTFPLESEIAQLTYREQELQNVIVTIYRTHYTATDFNVIWKGERLASMVDGSLAIMETGNAIQLNFLGSLNSYYYQTVCNHVLFDARCGVDETAFQLSANVTAINGVDVTFDGPSVALGYLTGGEFKFNGKSSLIVSSGGNTLILTNEVSGLLVGNSFEAFVGCDHSIGTCHNKFNNEDNYGAFPNIPNENIY